MGWWNTGILDGDAPLDNLGAIADILGVGDLYPPSAIVDTNTVRNRFEEHAEYLFHGLDPEDEDDQIKGQVLASLACSVGAHLEPDQMDKARACAENDTWAKTDPGRAADIVDLLHALDQLGTGTATVTRTRGLLEQF